MINDYGKPLPLYWFAAVRKCTSVTSADVVKSR